MAQSSPRKSASQEDQIRLKQGSEKPRFVSGLGIIVIDRPSSTNNPSPPKKLFLTRNKQSHQAVKTKSPHGFQTKTSSRLHAKIIPQEIELQSVISEEEENIMSTGGAIDEDGINQSNIYTSSIRSVKRTLGGASNEELNAVRQLNPISSPNEESKQEKKANLIKDYVYVSDHGEEMQNHFSSFKDHIRREPVIKEEMITVQIHTTESEEEVIFYSEGLSNHATSYDPSGVYTDRTSRIQFVTGMGSQGEVCSQLYSQHSEIAAGFVHSTLIQGYCHDCTVSSPSSENQYTFAPPYQNINPRQQGTPTTTHPKVNDINSNSTICQGDTGGQQQGRRHLIGFNKPVRPYYGTQATTPLHTQHKSRRWPLADLVRSDIRVSKVHQRIRSTENTKTMTTQHFTKHSIELLDNESEIKTRPRNDSSGGTKQSPKHRLKRIEQLQQFAIKSNERNDQPNTSRESNELNQLMSPPSDIQQRLDISKSADDEQSPITMGDSSTRSPPVINRIQNGLFGSNINVFLEFCHFLSQKDFKILSPNRLIQKQALSKEEQLKQQTVSQSVESYYKSNNSTPGSKSQNSSVPPSRQKQLFQYTVGTVANHQRYAASLEISSISNKMGTPISIIQLKGSRHLHSGLQQLNTPLRLNQIFSAILQKTSPLKSAKEVQMMRKLAMWALCLIMLSSRDKFDRLPLEFAQELNFFKDEIENINPCSGKVQMSPIPEIVKRMLSKDSNVINRIKTESYTLDSDKRIWTFPKFKPISTVTQITEALINEEMRKDNFSKNSSYKSPSFGFSEVKNLADVDPDTFGEVFPDPQDYCIGVILQYEPAFQPLKKFDHISSLDARIEQSLKNSNASKQSESPRWMHEIDRDPPRIAFTGVRRSAANQGSMQNSKDMSKRIDTIDTFMEVPDEGMVDISEFTDVEINKVGQRRLSSQAYDGPQDLYGWTNSQLGTCQNSPDVTQKFSAVHSKKRKSHVISKKVNPPAYGLKLGIARNVKNSWQRSITAVGKNPQRKSSLNGSGRKTVTTKLNYGGSSATTASIAQHAPQPVSDFDGSLDKRANEEQPQISKSMTSQKKKTKKTNQSTTIQQTTQVKKNAIQVETVTSKSIFASTKKHLIQRLAAPASATKYTGKVEEKNQTNILNQSAGKVQCRVDQQSSAKINQQANSLVAHHARSFAISSVQKPIQGSFAKTTTISVDSSSKRMQQHQPSGPNSNTWSPRESAKSVHSNYRLTQQLPQTQRNTTRQSNQLNPSQNLLAQQTKTLNQKISGYQSSRTKTSLESHLLSRVMQTSSVTAAAVSNGSQDQKNSFRQALIMSAKQSRRAAEAAKLPLSAIQQQTGQPSQTVYTQGSTQRSSSRRLPKSFQQSIKQVVTDNDQPTKTSSRNTVKLVRELSLSKSAKKIQETLENRSPRRRTETANGNQNVQKKKTPRSSQSSFIFAEQDEPTVTTQNQIPYKPRAMKKSSIASGKADKNKTNLNAQLYNKLMIQSPRVSQTPGSKVGGVKNTQLKNMLGLSDNIISSTIGGTNANQLSSRRTSVNKSNQQPNTLKNVVNYDNLKMGSQGTANSQRYHYNSMHQNMLSPGTASSSATPTPMKKHNLKQLLQPVSITGSKLSTPRKDMNSNTLSTQLRLQMPQQTCLTLPKTTNSSSTQLLSARSVGGQPSKAKAATITKTFIQLF